MSKWEGNTAATVPLSPELHVQVNVEEWKSLRIRTSLLPS